MKGFRTSCSFSFPELSCRKGGLLQGAVRRTEASAALSFPLHPPGRDLALIAADDAGVAFRWKDYRLDGPGRWKTMRLHPHEFIRRFLLHVLPKGFHRIRHYGLFANANRADNIAKARALLGADPPAADPQQQPDATPDEPRALRCPCPRCGARMIVIEVFARGCEPRWRPTPTANDTS